MSDQTDNNAQERSDASRPQWLFLAYKVPSELSSNRVPIWRELKRLGAYYPQQAVCILPGRSEIREQIGEIRRRVADMGVQTPTSRSRIYRLISTTSSSTSLSGWLHGNTPKSSRSANPGLSRRSSSNASVRTTRSRKPRRSDRTSTRSDAGSTM